MSVESGSGTAALVGAVLLSGIVTDEGENCTAMRGDDGELYTFEAIPPEIRAGDRLQVDLAEDQPVYSVCDQGKTVRWRSLTRLGSAESPPKTWKSE